MFSSEMTELSMTREKASAMPPRIIVLIVLSIRYRTTSVARAEIGMESSTATVARTTRRQFVQQAAFAAAALCGRPFSALTDARRVFGPDQAAGCRPHSERLEESSSYASHEHALRLQLIGADSGKVQRVDDQIREDMITVAQSLVSVPRETVEGRFAGILMQQFNEPPWVSHREST